MSADDRRLGDGVPCEVIWLREVFPHRLGGAVPGVAGNARRPQGYAPLAVDSARAARRVSIGGTWALALAFLVIAGQVAALPALAAASGANPWLLAFIFGAGAAAAAKAARAILARSNGGRAQPGAPNDFALHDAFTLSAVLSASATIGHVGAALLLPASITLARIAQRAARRRTIDDRDALLLIVVAIAVSGLCQAHGWRGWMACGAALGAAGIARTLYKNLGGDGPTPLWSRWAVTALLCAAMAALEVRQAVLSLEAGPALTAAFAGIAYGAAAEAGAWTLSRYRAQIFSASAPFLAVAIEVALGGEIRLAQLAAAILLAGALVGSIGYARSNGRPAAEAIGRRVAGWPRFG